MKPYCNDLKFTIAEFQKEIDEHGITDEETLRANTALEEAFGFACAGYEMPDCEDLIRASEIWREEIDKYSNLDIARGKFPFIPTLGRLMGKGPAYYKRVQNGVDGAIRDLKCDVKTVLK